MFVIALMQPLWDQGEPAGWMSSINNPPPGMATKQILLQSKFKKAIVNMGALNIAMHTNIIIVAFGDAQVSYLGAEIMARAFNASNVGPQVRSIFGVPGKLLYPYIALIEY